jgi:hypothetical protein
MKLRTILAFVFCLALVSCGANVLNYMDQGGARSVVGGSLDVVSGGTLDVKSGATLKLSSTAVTATATELNLLSGASRMVKVARVALTAADTAGGVFAWANPTGGTIIVTKVILDVTTQSTGSCTVDVGVAANGTTSNATLLTGASVAAVALLDNVTNKGASGLAQKKVTSTQFVTASVASGASAGLVGFAYIYYHAI